MRRGFFGLLAISMICWAGNVEAETFRPYPGDYVYADPSRLYIEYYRNGTLTLSPFDPAARGDDPLLRDCSTAEYRCVASMHNLMAVPRGELSTGATYRVENTFFTVLECKERLDVHMAYPPERKPKCESALIMADCQWLVLDEDGPPYCRAVDGGRRKSPKPGPVVYFLYHELYGVTASGGAWNEQPNPTKDRTLMEVFLVGDRGFLAP
ncbi:MAG: hypothetical protein ACT6Q8_15880 [Niveispirillum sp.]|uniref:hypothetical protein n=1 Tax=Niveispirillum sp. TaxID=1917217 RepID=UPI0012E32E76